MDHFSSVVDIWFREHANVIKQIIGKVIVAPYRVSLLAYLHAHPVQSVGALAFVVEPPAFPATNIFFTDIQLCSPFHTVGTNVPFPHAIPGLCGCGANRPRHAVDCHGVAVGLPEGIQHSAFGLGIKLRTRLSIRQPATHVRKEWQPYTGQVGGIAARSVSHWLASCELLRINCERCAN